MSWQDMYARVSVPFGELGPFYDALGHKGADYPRGEHEPVYAYSHGTVEVVGHSGGLGGVVAIEDSKGYAAWAHLVSVAVSVGDDVEPGTVLGYAAGRRDDHGSLWDGSHSHTTRSAVSASDAAYGIRPLLDPAPIIAAFLIATAGGDRSSITNTETRDPDMARRLNIRETKDGTNNTPTLFFDGGPGVGIKPIQSPAHLTLLNRYLADKPGDHMYPSEIAIVNGYLRP
ncbi:M23 family metallopeptidase [Glaciibacter flavus]|uniref:M23 family metallopeptidase n=1 Tax=Orlajensenia flava TaxID=2565934 RepID=UPI003B00B0BA